VTAILQQLGLDSTFFTQLGVFFFLFIFLGAIYFNPFLKLLQERHRRTVEDRQRADTMMAEAATKLSEYQAQLQSARVEARAEMEKVIAEAKAAEAKILSSAREEARKIAVLTASEVDAERVRLRAQLELDAEALASAISEKLLIKKG
jgi:F-type H+-transporting ATPase subunit b